MGAPLAFGMLLIASNMVVQHDLVDSRKSSEAFWSASCQAVSNDWVSLDEA